MSATSNNIISLRRHDLDNLRTFLTGLVVVHHTAVTYGAPGQAPFRSAVAGLAMPGADLPLIVSAALDQSFFMGLFFWISGRVSAQSLERVDGDPNRTRWSFVKSKALRLGLVAVLYTLVADPAMRLIALPEWSYSSVSARLVEYFSTMRSVRGPVWYTTNLLLMDTVAALVAPPVERSKSKSLEAGHHDEREPPLWYTLLARYGWAGAAVLSFFIRLYYPLGKNLKIIALQPSFASQYILAYITGHASWRYGTSFMGPFTMNDTPEDRADKSTGSNYSVATAVLVSLLAMPIVGLPYLFREADKDWIAHALSSLAGGWNWPALLYAVWNEFSYIVICPALVRYFATWHNRPVTSGIFQAKYSYGAFLVHMLASILPEVAFDRVLGYTGSGNGVLATNSAWRWLGPSIMTVVVGAANVYSSFGAAKVLLDAFPALRNVI